MGVLSMKDQIDMVNSPPHYNQYGIECIQAIKASMSHLEFCGYLKGNQLKYLWRYRYKGKMKEDLEKAQQAQYKEQVEAIDARIKYLETKKSEVQKLITPTKETANA